MNRSGTILLVEDNPDDADLAVRAFRKSSISNRLVIARDGQEALDFVFAEGAHSARPPEQRPEVVLLDLKLPRVDGLAVLRRIRDDPRTRRLAVVVLTSSKEDQDVIQSYDLGANSFVRKPVDFAQFSEAARQLGLYWLLLNEPPPEGAAGERA
jgi:two-component system, response regulator